MRLWGTYYIYKNGYVDELWRKAIELAKNQKIINKILTQTTENIQKIVESLRILENKTTRIDEVNGTGITGLKNAIALITKHINNCMQKK